MLPHKTGAGRPEREGQTELETEADLVAAAKAGDRDAFTRLVRASQADVYALARRLVGNQEDARDVAQETYLNAFKSLHRFRGDARFSTWMHTITANCANTYLVQRRRREVRGESLGNEHDTPDERIEADPSEMGEQALLRTRLEKALLELTDDQRMVIVLRDIYDLSHEAIAKELGISKGTAKVRLSRARRILRQILFPQPGDKPRTSEDPLKAAFLDGSLEEALSKLPPTERTVVSLHFQGLSNGQIASQVGLVRNTVKHHLSQGKKRLRRAIGDIEEPPPEIAEEATGG